MYWGDIFAFTRNKRKVLLSTQTPDIQTLLYFKYMEKRILNTTYRLANITYKRYFNFQIKKQCQKVWKWIKKNYIMLMISFCNKNNMYAFNEVVDLQYTLKGCQADCQSQKVYRNPFSYKISLDGIRQKGIYKRKRIQLKC